MLTWRDATLDVMLTAGQQNSDSRTLTHAKRAVVEAVNRIAAARKWNHFVRRTTITTQAAYSTGTVAYDHSGGANERQLTLTTGTWPTWADYGSVTIDSVSYRVGQRVSASVVILKSDSNPGADVASGTTYELYRDSETLPADFGRMVQYDRINNWDPTFVSAAEFRNSSSSQEYTGQPRVVSIFADPRRTNRRALWLYPGPTTGGESIDIAYYSRPVPPSVFDVNAGTVSVSVGGRGLTGVSTAFTAELAGCVIQFGTSTLSPEPQESSPTTTTAPFDHENMIDVFTDTTNAILQWDADLESTAVKYRISSYIDAPEGPFRDAIMACARWRFFVMSGGTRAGIERSRGDYDDALRAAARDDTSNPGDQGRGGTRFGRTYAEAMLYPQVEY